MTKYESELKTICLAQEVVFNMMSDLNNLEKFASNPDLATKAHDISFDSDRCSFNVDGFGRVAFCVVERVSSHFLKFASENMPVSVFLEVKLAPISENECSLQLTLNADLPAMIKMMMDKKLTEGINAFADVLVKILK
ncbi:MAG: polyketide cyclase [Porphyromonadaceae bacterium CG2_30_38_12]|nr:MAG: polyketide cyclase [Porphyromonadaceae bacterium CG2_30_38_12]